MTGRVLVGGEARAEVLILDEPLSLWGGVDPATGMVVEAGHPQHGESLAGKIVVMSHGRGSSSSSSVLAEMLRLGSGPAGIVLEEPDSILVVGSLVAGSLYGVSCPVIAAKMDTEPGAIWSIGEKGLARG